MFTKLSQYHKVNVKYTTCNKIHKNGNLHAKDMCSCITLTKMSLLLLKRFVKENIVIPEKEHETNVYK